MTITQPSYWKPNLNFKPNYRVRFMVFNVTFNNISAISWRSVLLVEETRVPGENHSLSPVADKLYHIILYLIHLAMNGGSNSQL